ncbi:MAG: hypothetical protein RIG62_12295 [Cyclobacteriaceae bacterium]
MKYIKKYYLSLPLGSFGKRWLYVSCCLLVVLGNRCQQDMNNENSETENTEPVLSIALQDGFEGEPVIVQVNGKEVYRKDSVQTDYRISLADSFEVPLPESPITVEVQLPQRQVTDVMEISSEASLYVGISWLDGSVLFRNSKTPFGYL